MNKTYRVLYNESTNTYVAVAEIAAARGKSAGMADGTVSVQATVRKPKGRWVVGWTLGAALLNFSMIFGFAMLPVSEAVAAVCTIPKVTATSAANNSLACGPDASTAEFLNSTAIGSNARATSADATAIGTNAVGDGSGNFAGGYNASAGGA